jgi:hypothetical protein
MASDDDVLYGSIKGKDIVSEVNQMISKAKISFVLEVNNLKLFKWQIGTLQDP